jgi:glycosyltransferase involved in cell wall biosynthesis
MPNGVSVVIPAWNEERRIGSSLEKYIAALRGTGSPYEIVVVIDGVTDRTAEVSRSYASQNVRVLQFDHRLGKGGALTVGLLDAKYSIVGYLDADSPISSEDIQKLINAIGSTDVAIASRRLRTSVATGGIPLSRRLFRVSFNALTRGVLGLPLTDTQCGAKFFRADALQHVLPLTMLRGWAFDAAILFQLRTAGYRIQEIPVTWGHSSESKLPLAEQVPVMFLSVFFIRLVNIHFVNRLPKKWTWWFARTFMKRVPGPNRPTQETPPPDGNDN